MDNQIGHAAKYWALFSACFIITICTARAQTFSHARDVVIEAPANLPLESRQPANALYLNTSSGDGNAYLYIEQQDGKRFVVLDVTDLAHIKAIRTMSLPFSKSFQFAEELNDSYIVLRSMDQKEMAILNIRKAKAPVLEAVDAFQCTGTVQPIGQSTFLLASASAVPATLPTPQEYRVIEGTKGLHFSTLYAAKGVIASISREETGTLFLLGAEGLTVIRHPEQEEEYETQQRYTN